MAHGRSRLDSQLIVIAPLAYRLRSKLLYRHPAFLICTDSELDPCQIIEAYFQRWDIEVNFRDEKTLLGVGQAQVRNIVSVGIGSGICRRRFAACCWFPVSWHSAPRRRTVASTLGRAATSKGPLHSTQQLIHQLRAEVWGRGLGIESFSGFASHLPAAAKPEKSSFPIASAVCYANG